MKKLNYIKFAALFLILALSSCKKEESGMAKAALPETDYVSFAAIDAPSQTIWVYADGDWTADVSVDWLTVDPMFGTGNTELRLVVANNVDSKGAMAAPRSTIVNIRGGYSERNGSFEVFQKGDTYLGKPEVSVTEALALPDSSLAKLPSSQVMALTTTGMVLSDGTSNLLTNGVGEGVKVGDKVYVNGVLRTYENAFPQFILDECNIISNGTAEYPTPTDVTSTMSSFTSDNMVYVNVKGSVVGLVNEGILTGAAIRVPGESVRMMVADVPASLGLADLNYHKLDASGYYTGKSGSNLSFIPVVVKDEGIDESVVPVPSDPGTVLFSDDFEWMAPFIADAVANGVAIGSSVEENNASASAPNLYTTENLKALAAELLKRGYQDVNPSVTSVYPQNAYWKFCRTSNHTGLQLPPIDYYGELQIGFDWSPQMTGSGNIDKVTLVVAVTTGSTTVIAGEFSYKDWTKGQLAWHAAKATINITPESTIQIRPSVLTDHDGITQQRFYLDNIVVKVPEPEKAPVYATITVDPDEALTFEGERSEKTIKVTSDYDFTINSNVDWLTLSVNSGLQNVETEIVLTCEASDLDKIREGKLTIYSEDSTKEIRVIQSAAGQTLEPFVALVGSNSAKISGQGEEFSVKLQSNVEFETKIDDSWLTAVPVASPAAMVETTTLKFKAEANLTGADRTGTIHFTYKDIESVLTVIQEKFEPNVTVVTRGNAVVSEGATIPVHIESNVDFKVSSSVITLPVSAAKAGEYDLNIAIPANTGSVRNLDIVFENEEYSYKYTYTLLQGGATTLFSDDFSWLKPLIDEYNASNETPIGNAVTGYSEAEFDKASDANAPNAYTKEPFKSKFPAALATAGYVDLNASAKVIYPQDTYLKLGKTSSHTALELPAVSSIDGTADVFLDFDWCAHIQGTGKIDPVTLTVVILGNGTFENGTKFSNALSNTQNAKQMFWTHSGVKALGIDKDTRFVIVYTDVVDKSTGAYNLKVSGAHRWHIDNIKITK